MVHELEEERVEGLYRKSGMMLASKDAYRFTSYAPLGMDLRVGAL